MRTREQVLAGLRRPQRIKKLSAPLYTGVSGSPRVMMAAEIMRTHVTDEGWQQALGLESAGYKLLGYNLGQSETDTLGIIDRHQPGTLLVQDKREWE
jgi:hypothetical protein